MTTADLRTPSDIRVLHGSRPDRAPANPGPDVLRAAAHRGDPPADALAEVFAQAPAVRREFAHHLLAPGEPAATPEVRALLEDMAARHAGVDDDLLDRASLATFTVPIAAHAFDVGAGALIRSYVPPGPAAVLVGTRRLLDDVDARLVSTSRWLTQASLPGGLRPGQPGWVSTGHVRMAHAGVRRAVRLRDPEAGVVPISQLDMVHTWLDFTHVAPRCAQALGQDLTPSELAALLRYWHHLGALLGVEPDLIGGAVDAVSTAELDERVGALTGVPSDDSRQLTRAGLAALARGLSDVSLVPERISVLLVDAVARAMHGPELSDALGIPEHGRAHELVAPVAAVLRVQRRLLRRSPVAWNAMVATNVWANRRFLATTRPSVGAKPPAAVASAA